MVRVKLNNGQAIVLTLASAVAAAPVVVMVLGMIQQLLNVPIYVNQEGAIPAPLLGGVLGPGNEGWEWVLFGLVLEVAVALLAGLVVGAQKGLRVASRRLAKRRSRRR